MWFKDFQIIKKIHNKYNLSGPLLDAGGLENPTVADYDISVKTAYHRTIELGGHRREIVIPHENQKDRYIPINRPWKFIDKDYLILNPENGAPSIEELPKHYGEQFQTVILTSVFEHVVDPFICSDTSLIVLPSCSLVTIRLIIGDIHRKHSNIFMRSLDLHSSKVITTSNIKQLMELETIMILMNLNQ